MEAQRNPRFREVLEAADLCMADGVGLLWAAKRLGPSVARSVSPAPMACR